MNFTTKRTGKAILVLLLAFTLFLCLTACGSHRLSQAEIEELREKYPVRGKATALVDLAFPSLAEVKERSETFVYGTVEGEPAVVPSPLYGGFFHCAFSVISDTAGVLQKGDKLDLVANSSLMDYNPLFADGMKLVIPVCPEEENDQYSYSVCGAYYITEDGYALSAFDEERAQMDTSLSGLQVERLLEELQK